MTYKRLGIDVKNTHFRCVFLLKIQPQLKPNLKRTFVDNLP